MFDLSVIKNVRAHKFRNQNDVIGQVPVARAHTSSDLRADAISQADLHGVSVAAAWL